MHPIIAEQIARERTADLLARADRRRRGRPARPAPVWRGRPARWLVAVARRLDPTIDVPAPAR